MLSDQVKLVHDRSLITGRIEAIPHRYALMLTHEPQHLESCVVIDPEKATLGLKLLHLLGRQTAAIRTQLLTDPK